MNPFKRTPAAFQGMPPGNAPQPPAGMQRVDIPGVGVGLYGLKADFHRDRHMAKQAKHPTDAGFDIYPTSTTPDEEDRQWGVDTGWTLFWVHTALHLIVPVGLVGLLRPRSSSPKTLRGGIVVEGTIDSLYTGEIKVRVQCPVAYRESTLAAINMAAIQQKAIAQVILVPYVAIVAEVMQALPVFPGGRNQNGFGSTDQ